MLAWIEILRRVDLFINNHVFLNIAIIATTIIPIYLEQRLAASEERDLVVLDEDVRSAGKAIYLK